MFTGIHQKSGSVETISIKALDLFYGIGEARENNKTTLSKNRLCLSGLNVSFKKS